MPAARRLSEKQLAADRADRDRLNSAAGVIRARAEEAYYKIGVFPDHAYPFATLLNVHIRDVPPGVRADALVVATVVENVLATPDTLIGESC